MKTDPETLLKLRKKQYGKKKFFEAKTIEFYKWLQDVLGKYSVSAPTVIDERVVTKYGTAYKSIIELLIYG